MTDQPPPSEKVAQAQAAYRTLVRTAIGVIVIVLMFLAMMLILFPPSANDMFRG